MILSIHNKKLQEYNYQAHILTVSSSNNVLTTLDKLVKQIGLISTLSNNARLALNSIECEDITHILIDINLAGTPCYKLIKLIRAAVDNNTIPIMILASSQNEERLLNCFEAGCDDVLFEPFTLISLQIRLSTIKRNSDLKRLHNVSVSEQVSANKIYNKALEKSCIQFDDISLLSKSKSIFSGDLFLTARHPNGSLNILLADFTGHGLPAAMCALPVVDIFRAMSVKGFDLNKIIESINNKLYTLLPIHMFMACSIINIANDLSTAKIWNAGMPDIYIRDNSTGLINNAIKSSQIPLGINDNIKKNNALNIIDLSPGDELILYSDGLTDAMNKNNHTFGCHSLDECLNSTPKDESIFHKLVDSFHSFCGDISPVDDVTLACILCTSNLVRNSTDKITGMA